MLVIPPHLLERNLGIIASAIGPESAQEEIGVILDLSGLTAILDFDAELGVVTLEPGVTQALLAEFLDRHAHPYLVPVTGAGPQCSLIGNALERGYGVTPHTDHFAAVTDLEAVLADGSVYQTRLHEVAGAELASQMGHRPIFPQPVHPKRLRYRHPHEHCPGAQAGLMRP